MAKAGTEQNVEDMLSSVRRLVSDELPRMPRAEVPKGPAALVLTEAQRIEPPQMGHNSRRKSLEDRIAELEAAVANSSDDYEPDGSEDLEQHRPSSMVFRPSRPVTKPPLQLTEVVSEDSVIARAEAAELEAMQQVPSEIEEAEVPQSAVEEVVTETVTNSVVEMAEDALKQDDTFERALAEAVGVEEIEAEATAPEIQSSAGIPSDLRPLISALIREELQGELGERITRNVRKLVRQEIQRALTVREIE